jgi:hypothetical protein
MKTLITLLAVATLFAAALPSARGQDPVSVDLFYETLSPHGEWFDAGDYGYVWQPSEIRDDWSPYSDGRWVYTDAGWTWDSAEPYGWAVYHYGRWADMQNVGWVWVPGTEWAPAWVSWRRTPEYVGWAPLPPEARFSTSIGISSWADDYYDIGPGHYRFVEGRNFGVRRLNTVFVERQQNVTIINQSTNITNISYRNNVIYNGGPDYDELSRRSSDPISRYRLDRRSEFDGNRGRDEAGYFQSRVDGDSYSVASPRLREGGEGRPAKVARTVADAEVNRGWRDVGNTEEVTQLRARMKSDKAAPADLPKQAEIVTRPGRIAAEAKGGNADRPRPGVDQNRGEGKGNKIENETGMRNLPPEPGAPRPNRETPGKGAADKGDNRPAPGNQAKEKGKGSENGGNPGDPPRPNRMPADAPAPGNAGKGENEGKGKSDRDDRHVNPAAPRPNRMPTDAPAPGNAGKGENEGKGKSDRDDRPVNPAAPRPNRMPADAPAPGNSGNGGKGKAERDDRPANPGANEKSRNQEDGRPSPNRESGDKGARPDRAAPAPAPNNRPETGRERMQPEERSPAPRASGANPEEKGRPAGGKSGQSEAEKEKKKEKARSGN